MYMEEMEEYEPHVVRGNVIYGLIMKNFVMLKDPDGCDVII